MKPNRLTPKSDRQFGDSLRAWLREHDKPQAAIADICGVNIQTVYSWVQYKTTPPKREEILTQEDILKLLKEEGEIYAKNRIARERMEAEQKPARKWTILEIIEGKAPQEVIDAHYAKHSAAKATPQADAITPTMPDATAEPEQPADGDAAGF